MALSVREMFLIVRAQDQASRTLASVGRQLGTLGRQSAFAERALSNQAARTRLAIRGETLLSRQMQAVRMRDSASLSRYTRLLAANEAQVKRLALQEAALGASIRQQRWEKVRAGMHALSDLGRVAQYGGAIATGALGAMAYSAANFNTAIVRAATQTGRSFNDVIRNANRIEPAVQSVMRNSASSVTELTDAIYEIYSSTNATVPQGVRLLRVLSNAAIGGMAPLQDVTKGTITVLNNFAKSADEAPKFLNRMFAAVRFGRTTFDEFAQTLSTTVPAAHQQNQSFDLMAGTISFLTRNLGNVSRASVGYARALEILNRQKTVENFKAVGVAIRDSHNRMLPLPRVLQNITRRFPGLLKGTKDWQNILTDFAGTQGTIQARRALAELTNDMDGYREIVHRVAGDNNEFARSVRALRETPGVQFRIFVNQLRAFALDLGRGAIPAFQKMIGFLQQGLDAFQGLNSATKGNIGNLLTWIAVLTTAAGTVAVLAGALGRLATGMRFLGPAGLAGSLLFGRQGNAARLRAADIRRARMLEAGVEGAAAGGILGRGRAGATAFRQARTEAGLLRSTLIGAGAAAAGIGVAMPLIATVLAGAAVSGGLLYLRMRSAREQAERLADAQQRFRSRLDVSIGQPLGIAARGPGAFLQARDQLLNLREVNAQIRIQRREMRGLAGDERTLAQVNLDRLMIRRRDVLSDLHRSTVDVRDAEANFTRALQGTNRASEEASRRYRQIQRLQTERARLSRKDLSQDLGAAARVREITKQIAALSAEQFGFRKRAAAGFAGLDRMINRAVQALQGVGAIRRRLPGGTLADIRGFARQIGRFPQLREIRALIRAEIDPRSLKNAPATVRAFFRTRPVHVPVALDFRGMGGRQAVQDARARATARQLGAGSAARPTQIKISADTAQALRQAAAARKRIASSRTRLPVGANTSPARQAVGGLIQWINSQTAMLHITVERTTVMKEVTDALGKPSSPFPVIQKFLDKHPNFLKIKVDLRSLLKEVGDLSNKKAIQETLKQAVDTGSQTLLDKFREFRDVFKEQFGLAIDDLNQIRIDWGISLNLSDLTKNLKKQNDKLKDHFKDMNALIRRGVPKGLLLQLMAMGPEGESIIDALAGSTRQQRRQFIQAWKQNQRLINRATMQAFRIQIRQWRRMGRSMALGIILGLRDEEAGLYRFFRRMFIRMLREARKAVGAHSPAREYQRLGQDIVHGLYQGLGAGNRLAVPTPGVRVGTAMGRGGFTQIVHAHYDESLDTTLARAAFRQRHRWRAA